MDAERVFKEALMKGVEEEFERVAGELEAIERVRIVGDVLYLTWLEEWVQLVRN